MRFFSLFKKQNSKIEKTKLNIIWDQWADGKIESPYAELMTYQSEINNGGHSQYFCNIENVSNLQKEMTQLERILPSNLSENLKNAYKAYLILGTREDENAEEILEKCDDVFYENEASINHLIEEFAEKL